MTTVTTSKRGYFGKGSVVVDSEGEGAVRRLAITADKLVERPFDGINVIPDVLTRAAREYGSRGAMGWRNVVKIHEEEKGVKKTVGGKEVVETKKWKYFELSDFEYISYLEVRERVLELARGLLHHGLSKSDVFNVYSQTSVNWQLMSHACTTISTPVATAYDTLGEAGLAHSLNEPNCAGIFTNAELLPVLARVIRETPSVRLVVYDGEVKQALLDQIHSAREGITVVSVDELRETGRAQPLDVLESHKPTPEDLALIMYTSGSTGAPKGVMLTHGNVVASLGGIYHLVGHHLLPDDTLLAYLPLAHILEYMVELTFFAFGVKTGYGRVKTLTDASVRNCKGDIAAFRPSILIGVPQMWETIRKDILVNVNASGSFKTGMFNGAMAVKKTKWPILTDIADAVVLSGVRAATGGRLRMAMSGGAPLSKETQEHLSVALVMMLQGYGMTESCAVCAILPPELMQYGSVGLPVPCIEVKLIDVPEAGYKAAGIPCQGEVCIRGPAVTKGYYKRPDLNDDETIFTKDGWLRTGDVGEWHADGTLSLIDRIENLVKLQGGEYIALGRLEATYMACGLVSNICVHASAETVQPIAIVIPHESALRRVLAQRSLPGVDSTAPLADLCQNEAVQALVMKECNVVGKKSEFKSMEMLEAVILTPDEWTPENGLVTAALKVQRRKVSKHFEYEIKMIYRECSRSYATASTRDSYERQHAVQAGTAQGLSKQPRRAQEESSSDKIVRLEKANQQLRNELSDSQRQRERRPLPYLVDERNVAKLQLSETQEGIHDVKDDGSIHAEEEAGDDGTSPEKLIEQLRRELADTRRAADENNQLLLRANDEITQLKETSEKVRRDFAESERAVDEQKAQCDEIMQLKQGNETLCHNLAESQLAVDEQKAQNEVLRTSQTNANAEITQLNQAIEELRNHLATSSSQLSEHQARYEVEVEQWKSLYTAKENELATAHEALEELRRNQPQTVQLPPSSQTRYEMQSSVHYGVACALPVDTHDQEHVRRRDLWETDPTGDRYVPGFFESKARVGPDLHEVEFRDAFSLISHDPTDFAARTVRIMCYRGDLSDPKWLDEDESSFSVLCTIHIDLNEAMGDLVMIRNSAGNVFYQLDYDVIVSLGRTGIRAEACWMSGTGERRVPARITFAD